MRKMRKKKKNIRLERERRARRKRMRFQQVLDGLKKDWSIKEIHRRTGLSEKNIRKIIDSNPEELTFLLLQVGAKNKNEVDN